MISVSTIKTYMYCPLKLYFQSNIEKEENEDYFVSKSLKDLRMDIQDLLHKNLRHIQKDMDEKEIEKRLAIGINNQIKATFDVIEEMNEKNRKKEEEKEKEREREAKANREKENINDEMRKNQNLMKNEDEMARKNQKLVKNEDEIEFIDNDKLKDKKEEKNTAERKLEEERLKTEELKKELISEISLNLKILSIKVAQAMKILDKNGDEIQQIFFPSCMYNYLIRDLGLDLIGVIDKIEVEKGNYFPISLKSSNPPIKGVWDGDSMEAIANALLIEQEFNTYVTVAYVDYLKIAERRAVIIDTDARKGFFKVLTHINKIVEDGEIPNVKTSVKKCGNCEYKGLCENS